MNNPWRDINLPVNPWENKKRQQQEAAEKKAAQEQGTADEQAEADAYNDKFNPELIDPAWAHADEARANESPEEAFIGDTIILSVKTKGIVPGGGIYCMVRDQSVDAPWKTERKLSGRVADDDTVSIEWKIDKNENDGESPDLTFWFEDKDVNKPAKSPEAKISLAAGTTVSFVEFPDTLFHKGCSLPIFDDDGALVAALTAVFTSAKKESGSTLVACGHAAKDDGGVYPALDVSTSRAKAIKALLADDGGNWSDIAQDFSCAKDIQQFLASAATLLGWSCDPGKVDGKIGPKTKAAIKKYKAAFNAKFKGSLADTDAPDGDFFGSMVTVIRAQVLESYKSASGETSLPDPAWVDSCKGTYGCGTSFPPEKGVSEIGRRVEVFFIPPDAKPVFTGHADDKTPVTTAECSLYGAMYERVPVETEPAAGAADGAIEVDFVMVGSPHFNHNCALPFLDAKSELIAALTAVLTFAKDNPDRELIALGHADTSGDPEYNLAISKRRAEAIKALLSNDISLWNTVVSCSDHKIEPEDYQATLKALADCHGWPCYPGAVDNKDGPKTQEAVKGFQAEYNKRYNKDLKVDGSVGPNTWEAIGIVIQTILQDHLKTVLKREPVPALTYGYPEGDGIYPCGESCPIENPGDPDCKSPENRRVELVFYKKGDPTPAIAPAAGREIGAKKDPVSEKGWEKQKIAPVIVDPLPIIKYIESESVLPEYWDPFLIEAPVKVVAAFSINVDWKGEITAMLLKGTKEVGELPVVSPQSDPIKVEWTGLEASGTRQPEATYSISLRLIDNGSVVAEKASSLVKLIRIGVEEISFIDSVPIRIYNDEIKSPGLCKAIDFSVPVPQWKIDSLNDPSNTKPHDHPDPSLEDRSADPDNYSYPVCYPMNSKSPAMVTIGGKGFEKADSLSVTLTTSINNAACPSSDNQAIQIGSPIHFENIAKAVESIQETITTLTFQFEFTRGDTSKRVIGKFKIDKIHIYTILSKPQEPWNNDLFTTGSDLWISVLQLLCSSWTKGLKTVDDAASAITDRIFNSGFKYDTVHGASLFTSQRSQSNLKDWLIELNLAAEDRKPMNCTDCATILTSLANSLGCELFNSQFFNTKKRGFDCHKIIRPIGFSNWDYPFSDGSRGGFSYHEIGWKNNCDESDPIFDPCLKTAMDPLIKPAQYPVLPVNIKFDEYEPKLVLSADLAGVKPAPMVRVRLDVQ